MWVLLSFLLAVALIYIEFFLPGGVLGVLGAMSLITSIGLGFYFYGAGAGIAIFIGEIVGAGVLLVALMKRFPHTRMGRLMILQTALDADAGYVGSAAGIEGLAGATGVAESALRPSGVVRIQGRRVDAVADGEFVEQGHTIAVVQVEGNRVVVRPDRSPATPSEEQSTA